jgi:cell division protein YceG involved in septum cleavage
VNSIAAELLNELRSTAQSLNSEEFERALVKVHGYDASLAAGLATLAKEFRFDKILDLLNKGNHGS